MGHRDHFVGELAEPEAPPQRPELPLQLRFVEDALAEVQLEAQPQRLERAAAEEDDLVEPAFVDVHHDLLAFGAGADRGQDVAGVVQELLQP